MKKCSKKAKKNITSDTIKRTIPIRNPYSTDFVWFPSNVLSLTTSRHQINIIKIKKNKLVNNKNWPWLYPWKYITPPVVVPNAAIEVIKGHGLGSTKWKRMILSLNFHNKIELKLKNFIYRSTSPNTISCVPIMVTASAKKCPADIIFNPCKW